MNGRLLWIVLVVAAGSVVAANPEPRDGWVTWQVQAAPEAPDWCCASWRKGEVEHRGCDLDGKRYGMSDDDQPTSRQRQVFAKYAQGQLVDSRIYALDCPVTAKVAPLDLGTLAVAASLARLAPDKPPVGKQHQHLLPVLAAHAGAEALALVDRWAAPGGDHALRKDSLFWLGQVRPMEAASRLRETLARDADASLREHAAFVIAQTEAAWRDPALIEAGRSDASSKVRGQAWFWLAQTGSPHAEPALQSALVSEQARDVREQLVFALSQLPAPRATDALIALIEQPGVARDLRERALFWLAQSDDDRAYAWLDRRLGAAQN